MLVFITSYDKGYLGFPEGIARLLSRVCDRSYAIYLVNGAVIALGLRLSPFNGMDRANTADSLLRTGGFLTCTLVMAELTYRLIEVPARRCLPVVAVNRQTSSNNISKEP
ncbi:hypothetical protein PQQ65_07690 [Paraburkholderia strydomiana]|uniref:hypothetical protein n=1 Tax=Paraburkholderia strydomiana TaxID=1245417 RepID=UPI0038BA1805